MPRLAGTRQPDGRLSAAARCAAYTIRPPPAITATRSARTTASVANQSWRLPAPRRPKRSCRRPSPAIAIPGVARRKTTESRHRDVAIALVSSGTAQEAKAIAGDLRGFRAKRVCARRCRDARAPGRAGPRQPWSWDSGLTAPRLQEQPGRRRRGGCSLTKATAPRRLLERHR
jgi:hypothetical protein